MQLTSGHKALIGTAIGGALIGAALVVQSERGAVNKLMPPWPQPRYRVAEVLPVEQGQLWRLADTGTMPRRPPAPAARQVNYVQGPSLIRHEGSTGWSLLVNAGYCCDVPLPWGPGFEGIARLALPAGQWSWLAACNDFGADSSRDEHELGFPAYVPGTVVYTATRWSDHAKPVHERIGVSLLSGSWSGGWTRPQTTWFPASGGVAHWSIAVVDDPVTTKRWLYTRETDVSGVQKIVRRQIMESGALGPVKQTTWSGYPAGAHPSITDIVRSGSTWYALEEVAEAGGPWGWHEIAEWRSVAQAQPIPVDVGVLWEPTGRRIRPGLRTVWDAGFPRAEDGERAGNFVLHLCGDGSHAEAGTWELCVWQPAGEVLPAALRAVLVPVTTPLPTPTVGPTVPPAPTPTVGPTLPPGPTSAPGGTATPTATATSTVVPPSATPEPLLWYRVPDGCLMQVSCVGDECLMAGSDATWQMVGPWTLRVIRP